MSTVRERVEKGAALLDEHVPGWHREVNLDQLNLASCEDCVCGQLGRAIYYGKLPIRTRRRPSGFNSMIEFLGRRLGFRRVDVGPLAEEYGFETYGNNRSYALLDREWGRLIRARLREEAKQT